MGSGEKSMATIFVIGAGPAGLFSAQKLALAGHEVVILNRDVKPGGLAEYGIYPLKDKMKIGLRKQFARVLGLPNVHYFGHVPVGAQSPISIDTLRDFCPAAMLFTVGAQGTKRLGLPGENASGVYSAKDFVYYYNQLPPFATQDFSTRKRVAIIGMGNVMVDIARWLLRDDPHRRTEEVIVVARRGPLEAKFDEKEFANIQTYFDRKTFHDELRRIREHLAAVGQDIEKVPDETFPCLLKYPQQQQVMPRLTFRFLNSPFAILSGEDGRIARLLLAENLLVNRNGNIVAEPTDKINELDVDTMIFAIGDIHDPCVGLPFGTSGYVTNPDVTNPRSPYEVFDPAEGRVLDGMFVAGWARKASEGLVGIARHDGETGASHVLQYLESLQKQPSTSVHEIARYLQRTGEIVSKSDLMWLSSAEEQEARMLGLAYYKFSDDADMLSAIERVKSSSSENVVLTAQ
jgi:ferredoxin/flavodoxin---NADP+ reductase